MMYKVCKRCLHCSWHFMETHVFQVNTFFRIYRVCAKWIFQLILASWGTDVVQVGSFEQQSRLLAVLQRQCVTAREKEWNRFHQCQMDFRFDSLRLKLLSQTHKCRFPSSSLFKFSFTQLCEKWTFLPPVVKKLAKLPNKLLVYENVTFKGVGKFHQILSLVQTEIFTWMRKQSLCSCIRTCWFIYSWGAEKCCCSLFFQIKCISNVAVFVQKFDYLTDKQVFFSIPVSSSLMWLTLTQRPWGLPCPSAGLHLVPLGGSLWRPITHRLTQWSRSCGQSSN